MDDAKQSLGERILLAARLAATLHLLEDVKEQRNRRQVEIGGADADHFTDEVPLSLAGRTPGEIPGRSTF